MMAENTKATIPAVPAMKLELVPVPVSDVERARAFYEKAGFHLEVDTQPIETMRVVQFTPPGSACSIVFGTGMGEITEMKPGSVKELHLVGADKDTARSALRAVQMLDAQPDHLCGLGPLSSQTISYAKDAAMLLIAGKLYMAPHLGIITIYRIVDTHR